MSALNPTALDLMDVARAEERAESLRACDEAFSVCLCDDGEHVFGDLLGAPWYASEDDAWAVAILTTALHLDGEHSHVVRRPAWEVTA